MGDKPFWKAERVIAVGMGGIGTSYIFMLSRMMSRVANVAKELIIVDGDVYSEKNLDRQQVLESDVGQQKARVWAKALAAEFKNLSVSAKTHYVTDKNIKDFNFEKAIVMLGVDNHATRKLFSSMCDRVKNVALVCGGNERVDGSVLLYVREGGEKLTPSLTDFHPEIDKPKDKNPGELSCAELAKLKGGQQIMNANAQAGMIMMNMFRILVERDPETADLPMLDLPEGECRLCKEVREVFYFEDADKKPVCTTCRMHACAGCERLILVDVSTDDELKGLCVRCAIPYQAEVYFDIRKNTTRSRARFIAERDLVKKAVEKPKEEVDQKKVVTRKRVPRKSKAMVPALEAAPPVEAKVEVQAAIAPPPAVDVAPAAEGPAKDVVGGDFPDEFDPNNG